MEENIENLNIKIEKNLENLDIKMEENIAPLSESSGQNLSATTKALSQLEKIDPKKRSRKGNKIPLSVRKKKLNAQLSKTLTPKNGLTFLNELRPGVIYKVHEYPGVSPPQFVAHIEFNNEVIGLGQGSSKSQAKTLAAENAIKDIVIKAISHSLENKIDDTDEKMNCDKTDSNTTEDLPWSGLASFAIFKMFSEWQSQGADFSMAGSTVKHKQKGTPKAAAVKEVPPNAAELHPSALLNIMKPGLIATELGRENGPNSCVIMGYMIDGQLYKGFGSNKKDAKKEAAKAALSSLWGVQYP